MRVLKYKAFQNEYSLCDFVNFYEVKQADIQSITQDSECHWIMFYWE